MKQYTTEDIATLFERGIDCSQVVVSAFAGDLGLPEDVLRRAMAAFGGGMQCGETCGAVVGALTVLGLKYGNGEENDFAAKEALSAKMAEFKRLYAERRGSTQCRDLLGHDISLPGEMDKVLEEGTMMTLCPCIVRDCMDILAQMEGIS